VDWAHGKDRNSFWVPGGLTSLQAWIRNDSLPKQIPHAEQANAVDRVKKISIRILPIPATGAKPSVSLPVNICVALKPVSQKQVPIGNCR